MERAEGKSSKIVSILLKYLPREYSYRIVFMQRKIDEIIASQNKMIERRGGYYNDVSDKLVATLYKKHLTEIQNWLNN